MRTGKGIPTSIGSCRKLVSYVEFKKGPYYADQGDFSTAGAYNLSFRDTVEPIASFGFGDYGYDRLFMAGSPQVGGGHLLYGLEVYHDNGSFVKPDEYHKFNALLRYSRNRGNDHFAVNALRLQRQLRFDRSDSPTARQRRRHQPIRLRRSR